MASREEQKRALREEREVAERRDAAAQRKRTAWLAGGIALIALIVVIALVLISQAGDDNPDVDGGDLFAGIPQSGITLGDPKAPVTVVEFADLQCPFCAKFATTQLPGVVDDYVRPGDVKMELKLLTFVGEDSTTAAQFAGATAEQDRIWPFAENFYSNQGAENTGYVTEDFLRAQAEGIDGLDVDEAVDASSGAGPAKYVEDSRNQAGEAGVKSTPTFLVGPTGGEMELVDHPEDLDGAIDDALAEAGK